ncbi:selenoprotein [Seminavis robusta]|uniref:Selenoprotein n=1 Tax=Seminavis robusta TaxID=568900 RepID=A0A9N8DUI9_9STRA|nr:selenoprotein [Seminavis robusta]|eukprot:Sro300_g111760.1 selenoprotein (332) ;mRNA; r:38240-39235
MTLHSKLLLPVVLQHALLLLICSVIPFAHCFTVCPRVPLPHQQHHGTHHLPLLSSSANNNNDTNEDAIVVNHVTLEYCTGCRWMARGIWMAQELLTTFNDGPLSAVTLVPSRPPPGATFCVTHTAFDSTIDGSETTVLWDRKAQEGFPELKELKQLVRDHIDPDRFLGHSDKGDSSTTDGSESEEEESIPMPSSEDVRSVIQSQVKQPHVAIQYCTGCRWMLRSAYFGTELLTTFGDEINSFTLIPSRPPEQGGMFVVSVNGKVIWDRAQQGGFPEVPVLKQKIRDILAPNKSLGHSDDDEHQGEGHDDDDDDDQMDDDEAADMRAFYGVQ